MTIKTKCAPKIWKKFNAQEKALWTDLYKVFLWEPNYHVDWADPKKFKKQREVTAHNLACEAVWLLQGCIVKVSIPAMHPSKKRKPRC